MITAFTSAMRLLCALPMGSWQHAIKPQAHSPRSRPPCCRHNNALAAIASMPALQQAALQPQKAPVPPRLAADWLQMGGRAAQVADMPASVEWSVVRDEVPFDAVNDVLGQQLSASLGETGYLARRQPVLYINNEQSSGRLRMAASPGGPQSWDARSDAGPDLSNEGDGGEDHGSLPGGEIMPEASDEASDEDGVPHWLGPDDV